MSNTENVYVVVTRGDGASVRLVPENCLKAALHAAMCTCPGPLLCQTEGVPELVDTLDDTDAWTHPYPDGLSHEWTADFEDGPISVFRLSDPQQYHQQEPF